MWRKAGPKAGHSELVQEIGAFARAGDLSRRIVARPGSGTAGVVDQLNDLIANFEKREAELTAKLAELTDAHHDAQMLNQLMRRLRAELKVRSDERDAALTKAEAASRAKSQFLANMSHEIRTPMHGILGLADVLARTGLDARQQSLVQTIQRSGNGLLAIINDVLDFSKIEAGKVELALKPFSISALVRDLINDFKARFETKGIEFVVRIDPEVPELVAGDLLRVKQVLTNLIGNGLKFTEQGFVIFEIAGEIKGETAAMSFRVQDTGIGIPPEKIETIFEKFNQADNSSTRRHEGTGLGLSISRMLIERMGGRLDAVSTLGRGSMFTIVLDFALPQPRASGGVALELAPASAPELSAFKPAENAVPVDVAGDVTSDRNVVSIGNAPYHGRRVLLVEDNPVNQEVAREFLGEMGCSVTIAHNGRESVEAVTAGHYDLIFMDCLMPEMDGFEATRRIRALEASHGRRPTPIVALTANAFEKDRQACIAAGMDDFLSKPFGFDQLQNVLSRWLAAGPVGSAGIEGSRSA